jgi:phage-related protein
MGTSHRDVTNFPDRARSDAGYGLHLVQQGRMPADWKPFETVGAGTYEIRIRTHEGGNVQHRVLYVAKFPEAVYVLHAFAKTTRETSAHDVEVGRARYAEMLRLRKRQLRD